MNPLTFTLRTEKWLLISLLILLTCTAAPLMPEEWGYENSWIENAQMLVMASGLVLLMTAKNHQHLYRFGALVLLLLMMREVSFGRTIFFAVPGKVNTFYKWKEIPYGWMAHILVGVYIALMVAYFVWTKVYREFWRVLTGIRIPVVTLLMMLLAMATVISAERLHLAGTGEVVEEVAELSLYFSLVILIYSYTRNRLPAVQEAAPTERQQE